MDNSIILKYFSLIIFLYGFKVILNYNAIEVLILVYFPLCQGGGDEIPQNSYSNFTIQRAQSEHPGTTS